MHQASIKHLAILALLAAPGCQGFGDTLKDPATVQLLDGIARESAKKAALDTAAQFQITDESAVKRMADEAQAAATASVNLAITRLEAKNREERAAWREQTKAQIGAALQGVGGALATTGNPILMGLGLLMGVGGLLTSKKKASVA